MDDPKSSNDTMTEVAKVAKTTRSKVYKTRVIEARATPEQKEQLVNGTKTINQVFVSVRRDEVKETISKKTDWPEDKVYNQCYTQERL